MKYGYARVSTDDQNADMQLEALEEPDARKSLKTSYQEPRPSALPCTVV